MDLFTIHNQRSITQPPAVSGKVDQPCLLGVERRPAGPFPFFRIKDYFLLEALHVLVRRVPCHPRAIVVDEGDCPFVPVDYRLHQVGVEKQEQNWRALRQARLRQGSDGRGFSIHSNRRAPQARLDLHRIRRLANECYGMAAKRELKFRCATDQTNRKLSP